MDQIKIGKFIAALRKEKCLTQEQLGEKLGVTNKTISRWENGNYMPDVEMLSLLSKEFGVSINELIHNFGQVAQKEIKVERREERPGDIYRSCLDNTNLKQKLGILPQTTLLEGLLKTYAYFAELAREEN